MAVSPEALLISSVIKNNDYKVALAAGLDGGWFHVHDDEWNWITAYYGKYRKTPSKVAFTHAFPDFRIRDVNDTQHFVAEVKQEHTRQRMTETLKDQADLLAQGRIQEACDLASSSIVKIAAGMGDTNEVDVLADWKTTYNEIKARKLLADEFGQAGIPTGMYTLDEFTGGVGPGQLWITGARLGGGKSWFLLKMATAAILGGYRAHFAALEMSRTEVSMRLHNLLSSTYGRQVYKSVQLSQGKDFDLREYRAFLADLPNQINGHLTVTDSRNIGAMEIAAHLERNKPDIYFLDYLTLAKTQGDGGWNDIGKFSKELKTLAGSHKVAMVAAAQLNREAAQSGKEPPGAETLAQADAIGQDADAVITLKKLSDRVTMAKMAKYRHGRDGFLWHMKMDIDHGVIEEISKNEAQDVMDQDADFRDKLMEQDDLRQKQREKDRKQRERPVQRSRGQEMAAASGSGKKSLKRVRK